MLLEAERSLCGLLLERREWSQLALALDDLEDGVDSDCPDELVLEVGVTYVEAECLHVCSFEVCSHSCPLETMRERGLLTRIAETCQSEVEPAWPEAREVVPDGVRAADRDHGDALGRELATAAPCERFERALVAHSLDEDRRLHLSISRNTGLKYP